MIRHKYTIYIQTDFTKGILGDFNSLMPEIGIRSDKVEVTTISTIKELDKSEQEHILNLYRDGLSNIKLPLSGTIVPSIRYMGTFESVQETPDEINLLEKL